MTAPIALPDDWDPGASVRADMDQAGELDAILKRHGLAQQGQFKPASPWDRMGNLHAPGYVAPLPGTYPSNGGIAR